MPEGDTIHILARALGEDLVGRRLVRVEVRGRRTPSLEREVLDVAARGKNLLVSLEGGEVIRVHLGMHGEWHRYPSSGRGWQRARHRASLRLGTDQLDLVCFDAEELEFLEAHRLGRSRRLRGLGPDLIADEWSSATVIARGRHLLAAEAPVVDLLLDQRVASGIGNVYKSEVLFLEGVHPRFPIGALDDTTIERLYRRASELLRLNLEGGPRITTRAAGTGPRRGPRLWVYGRAGDPCLECGATVSFDRFGRGRRSTYWCESCQRPPCEDGIASER